MASPDVESIFYSYVERSRTLLSAETWQRLAMDLSKNDFLALLFLRRYGESRMSDLALFLDAPLNTATGVVSRLQRRGLVERRNSPDDKRVVVVSLSPEGREQVGQGLRRGLALAGRVLSGLSPEQVRLLLATLDRIIEILSEELTGRPEQARAAPPQRPRRIAID